MCKLSTKYGFLSLICILNAILWTDNASAQQVVPKFGLVFDRLAYDSLTTLPLYSISKDINLPERIDLSPFCPPVRNQGSIESCVGWSLGYGVMSINQAIRHNWTDQNQVANHAYSALFIYNQVPKEGCVPISFFSALAVAKQKGNCSFMNFDAQVGIENCQEQPSPTIQTQARRDTLIDFHKLFESVELPLEKVRRVRSMLAQKRPVLIGVSIPEDFAKIPKGVKYYIPGSENYSSIQHAMVAIGYDHTRRAIRVFNSWGTDWADNGCVWIPYEVFGKYCMQAFVLNKPELTVESPVVYTPVVSQPGIQTQPKRPDPIPERSASPKDTAVQLLTPSSVFASCQLIAINSQDNYSRTAVTLQGKTGVYHTLPDQWPIGQLFQLNINNSSQDLYCYAFSVDPWFNVKIHWPRRAFLDPVQFKGINESAFLPASSQTLIIPAEDTALELANVGTDVLYVFFTNRPISNQQLRILMERLRNYKSNYQQRLVSVLSKDIIPDLSVAFDLDHTVFDPDRMTFNTAVDKAKPFIVPLVLELNIKP